MIRRAGPIGHSPANPTPEAQSDSAAAATRDFGLRRFVPSALQERLQPLQRRSERAMRRAAHLGRREPVQALLAAGIDPTARSRNGEGDTALHRAARASEATGSPLEAMLLYREHALEKGLPTFDVNAPTVFNPTGKLDPSKRPGQIDGDTALITAARAGNLANVEALLRATGIDPTIKNGAGFAAKDVVDPKHVEVRRALLSWRPSNPDQEDDEPPPAYQKDVPLHLGHSRVPLPPVEEAPLPTSAPWAGAPTLPIPNRFMPAPKPNLPGLDANARSGLNPSGTGNFKIPRKPVPTARVQGTTSGASQQDIRDPLEPRPAPTTPGRR